MAATIYDSKRLIGRRFSDDCVREDLSLWPFQVVSSSHDMAAFQVADKTISPEEVGGALLSHLKAAASESLGCEVTQAVVTVPAYFNDAQRQATKDAGRIGGVDVVRIINEPTAAAIAYGLDRKAGEESDSLDVLVFDFGGGTLDVTVLTIADSGKTFEVLSTSGDTHLGGADFDQVLMNYFAEEFCAAAVVPGTKPETILKDTKALRKLKKKAKQVKHSLSSALEVDVEIDALYNGEDLYVNITRAKFNSMCSDIFRRMTAPVTQALIDASLDTSEIDEVVLIGGSTRIPDVQSRLSKFFGGKSLSKSINPDEAVAIGAAIQAANLSLGVEEKKGTKLEDITLMDVTPMSLGIELANGKLSVLVPRNTSVPYVASRTFYNNKENQKYANVIVYEGENLERAKANRPLGRFRIGPLPPMKRGTLGITVEFRISVESVLEVAASAATKDEKIEGSLRIDENKGLLSEEQILEMTSNSESMRKSEQEAAARKKMRHELMQFINSVQQDIVGYPQDVAALVEKMLNETTDWIENKVITSEEMEAQLEYLREQWALLCTKGSDLFK